MTVLLASAAAIAGAIVGSYLATLILRWPAGRSASAGRSSCDRCGATLAAIELVPLLSYAVQRGACRRCRAIVDPLHWRVEALAAAIGGVALLVSPTMAGAALAMLGWMLIPLALLDWRHHWLPDRLTLALAVAGVAVGGWLGGDLVARLIGGVAGYGVLTLLAIIYRALRGRDGLGAGDAKLLGALGLWLGWTALAPLLSVAALLGLAVAVAQRKRAADAVPFGTMLAIAAWLVALAGAVGA